MPRAKGRGGKWQNLYEACVLGLRRATGAMVVPKRSFFVCMIGGALSSASAIEIEVDYRYDSNDFFSASGNPQGATGAAQARAALQAAADRWSAIIDQSLGAVSLADDSSDVRIGFSHPGTGASYQVSAAVSQSSDALAFSAVASEYRGPWAIAENVWILYAGGRVMGSSGAGGTGTGLNFTNVFDDADGIHNRGFNVGFGSLPVWGGTVTFNSSSTFTWHFDITSAAPLGTTDFYSIALHEIAHALGINTGFDDWEDHVVGGYFTGANAVAAYNTDNGTSLTRLLVQSGGNHWRDGLYESLIFPAGNPNYAGTVGAGNLQDLMMEPIANFFYPGLRRLEVTNTDVGAALDVGWSVIDPNSQPSVVEIISALRDASGVVSIEWVSEVGASYTVRTSTDLLIWESLVPVVIASGATTMWTDSAFGFSGDRRRFYQIQTN